MFGKSNQELKEYRVKVADYKAEIEKLKEELADLKLKKKIEDEDIRHMIKIKQEALEIEKQKAELAMQRKSDETIAEVKDDYRDKLEEFLQKQVQDVKEMYAQILKRLPEINVRLSGDV